MEPRNPTGSAEIISEEMYYNKKYKLLYSYMIKEGYNMEQTTELFPELPLEPRNPTGSAEIISEEMYKRMGYKIDYPGPLVLVYGKTQEMYYNKKYKLLYSYMIKERYNMEQTRELFPELLL